MLVALIFALTIVVFFLLYFGPYRNPGWLSPGFAGSLCLFGIAAFSTGEFIREAVRKPFVVYNVVLGNQVLPRGGAEVAATPAICESGMWTKAYVAEHYPQAIVDGRIDGGKLLKLPHAGPRRPGRGPVPAPLQRLPRDDRRLFGRRAAVARAVARAGSCRPSSTWKPSIFMPPWCGTPRGSRTDDRLPDEHQPAAAGRHAASGVEQRGGEDDGSANADRSGVGAALPAPFWFVQFFKWLGFTLHAVPMNLWYAGLLVALWLHLRGNEHARRFAARLLQQMPVIVASASISAWFRCCSCNWPTTRSSIRPRS